MARFIFAMALLAAAVTGWTTTFTSDAFAAYCESVPPSKKFMCCKNHPRAAACR